MDGMINWLLNKRIEIVFNPKPYDRKTWLSQPKFSLAPSAYFLWGYDIGVDKNLLAFRVGPKTSPSGIVGWALDLTFERRGPIWRWPRVRRDWSAEAVGNAEAVARIIKWQEERAQRANAA
jgi:hypothetical protein